MSPQRPAARLTRRSFLGGAAGTLAFPHVLSAQRPLSLRFVTIPDPDGWHESLRLKGDWLVFEISDGRVAGYGEASHSRDDARCREVAARLFERHYAGFEPTLERLADKEAEIAALAPDFVTATAFSGLNQALYDLLAKREQVPVWQLFADGTPIEGVRLYTTINRALQTRTRAEYLEIVGRVVDEGFEYFKCAPFEAVDGPERRLEKARAGLETLSTLRERFDSIGVRVDFHERFSPEDFFALLPELERLELDWIEEPFAMGEAFAELQQRTALTIAAGELFWGRERFERIAANGWADVVMPDVKHVGGFGPLLDVLRAMRDTLEISPHNPSGPISTAASLHAAALFPDTVRTLEYAFDRTGTRARTGERVENGMLYLGDAPGWGVQPPA